MEANDKNSRESAECFCNDLTENRASEDGSTISSSDYRYTTKSQSISAISDLELMRRSGLTVEQIFAQEIYAWRKQQGHDSEKFKGLMNINVERPSHRRLSDESDVEPPSYAAALQRRRSTREANHNSHLLPTGEEDQDQRQFPSKRSTVGADRGKNMSFHRSQMENVEMPDLMGHFQLDPKISNSRSATALMNLRKSYTPSPTGSKDEESEKDPEACHEKRVLAAGPIIRDILRLTFVATFSAVICYLPWIFVKQDQRPVEIKFENLTRHNICFWLGSTGILDDDNPCPFRPYLHISNGGLDCIYWNDVHENASLVARIRERANEVGEKKADGKSTTDEWKAMIALDHLEDFKNKWPVDYNAPFCRRLFRAPPLLYPHCYAYPKDQKKKGLPPTLVSCWGVPCTQKVANDCYKRLWERRNKKSGK